MDIAFSGFSSSIASQQAAGQVQADAARQKNASESNPERNSEQQRTGRQPDTNPSRQNRIDAQQRTPETTRIIDGEVLSSETTRVPSRESTYSLQPRNEQNEPQAYSTPPDNRRISVQQALQTFEQNEALTSSQDSPRQVSGIIDEYV